MKLVHSNDMVAHLWASQSQPEARRAQQEAAREANALKELELAEIERFAALMGWKE